MYEIVENFPNEIIYEDEGPFISLYQPTFRRSANPKQDIIRFKNLVQRIQKSLQEKYNKDQVRKILKPFHEIEEDRLFWNNSGDGLAILSNKNKTIVYKLNRQVEELALVSDSFHIKPLLRIFQSADRYHLLGINRKNFVLYEGSRYGFSKIEFHEDTPTTIDEVVVDEHRKPHLNIGARGGSGGGAIFHGHGDRQDAIEKDTEKFFRYVDKLILDKFSNEEKIPLILIGLDEHHGVFRNITNNPFLMDTGIKKDYEVLNTDEIKEEAWQVMEPFYLNKTKEIVEKFETQRAQFMGTDDLAQVARATVEGRINTLLVEADRIKPGKLNQNTGEIISGDLENPEFDDVLDDIAEVVFKFKGNLLVLPKERMPSTTGVAAIYKF